MAKKPPNVRASVSSAEARLFRNSVSQVEPLSFEERAGDGDARPHKQRRTTAPLIQTPEGIEKLDGDLFYRPGVSRRLLNDLRSGRIRPGSVIDLHGCTRVEAKRELAHFVERSGDLHERCLLVITGRGSHSPDGYSPVREEALALLRQLSAVQAYTCAQADDGGSGAFYVLTGRPSR
ncbi:MAG: Smr/MutS family protein [Arenicellales bacterium]|nr:Smr/MutS family protein [Arenicellales bacterium]